VGVVGVGKFLLWRESSAIMSGAWTWASVSIMSSKFHADTSRRKPRTFFLSSQNQIPSPYWGKCGNGKCESLENFLSLSLDLFSLALGITTLGI
jgi:hypothetical protein